MTVYWICISLHLLAAALWLGHMFVWSLLVGPAMKTITPPETSETLRERSLFLGALGWPALAVLVLTGAYLVNWRGLGLSDFLTGAAFQAQAGSALAVKLILVGLMIAYQAVFGHRRAPLAIYGNMLAALIVLGASVLIARGGA